MLKCSNVVMTVSIFWKRHSLAVGHFFNANFMLIVEHLDLPRVLANIYPWKKKQHCYWIPVILLRKIIHCPLCFGMLSLWAKATSWLNTPLHSTTSSPLGRVLENTCRGKNKQAAAECQPQFEAFSNRLTKVAVWLECNGSFLYWSPLTDPPGPQIQQT